MWPKNPTATDASTMSDDAVFVEYASEEELLVRRVYERTTTETIEEVFIQNAAPTPTSSPVNTFADVKLDHLTQRFQQLCFNSSSNGTFASATPANSGPQNAVIPHSLAARSRRPPPGVFVYEGEPYVFNTAFNPSGPCVHVSQPGRCGFKMFLRMTRGLQTRLRTLSEMDGRTCRRAPRRGAGFNPGFPLRASPYSFCAPTPPPSPRRNMFSLRRGGSRFDMFQPSARIPEESFEEELSARLDSALMPTRAASPSSPRKKRTLEDILRTGTELPRVFDAGKSTSSSSSSSSSSSTELQTLQQARDIDRVVRGLKFLAVT